mgnify:CR=1 FL=1
MIISGAETALRIQHNTANMKGGGWYIGFGSTVEVKSGALVLVNENIALQMGGGLWFYKIPSKIKIDGSGTRVVIQANKADSVAGGLGLIEGARAIVTAGAYLNVSNNSCREFGAGIYLVNKGSRFDVSGQRTSLLVSSNIVSEGAGGGIAISTGSVIRITSPSVFSNNQAERGHGGAIAVADRSSNGGGDLSIDDGNSNCVSVTLYMESGVSSNPEERIVVNTQPNSQLSSNGLKSSEKWAKFANKKTDPTYQLDDPGPRRSVQPAG